tara:strand:+ start:292 stop:444 length:153 start_codon:yes stop_codon:yes gene_type:complete
MDIDRDTTRKIVIDRVTTTEIQLQIDIDKDATQIDIDRDTTTQVERYYGR